MKSNKTRLMSLGHDGLVYEGNGGEANILLPWMVFLFTILVCKRHKDLICIEYIGNLTKMISAQSNGKKCVLLLKDLDPTGQPFSYSYLCMYSS